MFGMGKWYMSLPYTYLEGVLVFYMWIYPTYTKLNMYLEAVLKARGYGGGGT